MFACVSVIAIAHNSGGPKSDIIAPLPSGQRVGYLASNASEYAAALVEIFASDERGSIGMQEMRTAARQRATQFSDEVFVRQLQTYFIPFAHECRKIFENSQQEQQPSNAAPIRSI